MDKTKSSSLINLKGISNPDCICYASTVIQQLFMIPTFRHMILESTYDCSLQEIFSLLVDNSSTDLAIDISPILHRLGNDIDMEIDVHTQKDANTFLMRLFSSLSKYSSQSRTNDDLLDMFMGSLSNDIYTATVDVFNPPRLISKPSSYSFLSLDTKNCSNLQQSFDAYVKETPLQFPWPSHDDPSQRIVLSSMKKTRLILCPEHLIIHLKRFEFDAKTRILCKRNHRYEFPIEFDVSPWIESTATVSTIEIKSSSYQLSGMVIHNGTASSGHYYSIIRQRSADMNASSAISSEWHLFDDELVVPFNIDDDLEVEAYGHDGDTDSGRNAFILIYDRI